MAADFNCFLKCTHAHNENDHRPFSKRLDWLWIRLSLAWPDVVLTIIARALQIRARGFRHRLNTPRDVLSTNHEMEKLSQVFMNKVP